MEEPRITVGICDGYEEIRGRLNGTYLTNGTSLTGEFIVRPREGGVSFRDAFGREILRAGGIRLTASEKGTFSLRDVTIGVRFHWERREEQTFSGDLAFLPVGTGTLAVVNEIPLEEYLASVVASEMNSEAPYAFLKAHAIASRSWLTAMLHRRGRATDPTGRREKGSKTEGEVIRWYDREDHRLFDVCADDHCQRYQGISGLLSGKAAQAVRETRGIFLIHEGKICDARYHKACGGITEDYATCWEEVSVPCLSPVSDSARPHPPIGTEQEAVRWILAKPDVYCHTRDEALLRRILPAFDRETADFFRWQVSYGREELEAILREKSGIDFGILHRLVPLERGPSGRIRLLRIEGSKAAVSVGKELEIRRWLSPSHLYSSAFIVSSARGASGPPSRFTFFGAGWGHGVGLCQIGAAVMAAKGFAAEEILRHYFRGAALVKRY
jgi:SpoIID/LytB domain protein